MRFSDLFNVVPTPNDDWFDPILTVDTRLFIDPFLVYSTNHPAFSGAHDEVIAFFNSVFRLVAQSGGDTQSPVWQAAASRLLFPEVEEVCLGYTGGGTAGSGSGVFLGRVIASALWEAVEAGLTEIRHFEEVSILRDGIGADRISDITASLIRARLASYTQSVARRHSIPLAEAHYSRGTYDHVQERWIPLHAELPRNPYSSRPILLVPRRYLRNLPTISPEDFWEYCYSNENETLRLEYSRDVTRRVDKARIISFARRHPEIRSRYIAHREGHPPESYNFDRDPNGLVRWYKASATYCQVHPLTLQILSPEDFETALRQMINEYVHFVENNEGWRLLWNDNNTPRKEEAAQLLFLGVVKHYCRANNIDISREADIGRGPVDFKASIGFSLRALLEVKLAKNSRFWHGLERQLPTYQRAEDIQRGFFIVVVYSEADLRRIADIRHRVEAVNSRIGYHNSEVIVDARPNPPSASML